MYLDKCRVRRLIRFQGLSAVPLAVALVCTILGIACAEQFGRAAVIALTVLTGVCSLAAAILQAVSEQYLYALCDEQLAYDRANGHEEARAVSERYHVKLLTLRNSVRHKLNVACVLMTVYSVIYARRLGERFRVNEERLPRDEASELKRKLQGKFLTLERRLNAMEQEDVVS